MESGRISFFPHSYLYFNHIHVNLYYENYFLLSFSYTIMDSLLIFNFCLNVAEQINFRVIAT